MKRQVWGIEMCGDRIANSKVFLSKRQAIEHVRKYYPKGTITNLYKKTGLRVVKLVWE